MFNGCIYSEFCVGVNIRFHSMQLFELLFLAVGVLSGVAELMRLSLVQAALL